MNASLFARMALVGATSLVLPGALRADWLQYRGPTQNGAAAGQTWTPRAAAAGKVLWKTEVGKGTSSVTVSDNRAYTAGNVDGKDVIYCLDAAKGNEIWRNVYPMSADPKLFEGGPRATPVLDGNRLYAVSHEGDLFCLDAGTGKAVWSKHYVRDFGGRRPDWGFSGSPLIKGNALYCDVGGPNASTVALDKATGKTLWKTGSDEGAYATPLAATLGGKEVLVVFKAHAVVGYDLASGAELWRTPWKTSYDINAATPLAVGGDKVFVGSGYNTGGALLQVKDKSVSQLWSSKALRTQINTATVVKDFLYGIDGDVGGGHLVCVALSDGAQKWQEKSVRGGALIESNGKLIILSERGELVVCEASPDGFKVLARAQVLNKRCWAQPTLDSGRLYVRSNEGTLVCLDVK